MTQDIFSEREKAFENKYAKDQEKNFYAEAQAVEFFALWAATRLGYKVSASTEYARKMNNTYMREGLKSVIAVVKKDLANKSVKIAEGELEIRFKRCLDRFQEAKDERLEN